MFVLSAFVAAVHAGPIGTTPLLTAEGDYYERLGQRVVVLGDVDGDGFADFAAGAWNDGTEYLADTYTFVYYGSADGPEPAVLLAGEEDSGPGLLLEAAGDIDGDGYADVMALWDRCDTAMACAFDGGSAGFGETWHRYGGVDVDYDGGIFGGGDLDGDGLPEAAAYKIPGGFDD
ncbi:MAG: hypothetical protein Q8P41_27545 [Pseudomonadota bacterium]|nr:hypothetical protein [Pseudomonadota bacterium]